MQATNSMLANIQKVTNPYVFFAAAVALFAYIVYMMIRKRKGLRRGHESTEPEI